MSKTPENSEKRLEASLQRRPVADDAKPMLRVVVIDDHPMFRAGVVDTLARSGRFHVVGEAGSADAAIRLAEELLPDIMLIDIRIPGDGIEAASAINQSCPAVKLVLLTAIDDEAHVTRGLRVGASGYAIKGIAGPDLVDMLQVIASGGAYVSPGLAARLLSNRASKSSVAMSGLPVNLSPREESILKWVAHGLSNREIGDIVGLSEKSIKHYMTNIMQKLHARNRVEAAMIARQGISPIGRN